MKHLISALCALLVIPAAVAASFEGKVTLKLTRPDGESMPMTFSLKPGFTRVDVSAPQGEMSVIMDQAKQQMMMLMPQHKMYMVHPLNAAAPGAQGASDVKVEKTDQHEKILGYDTTKYVAHDATNTTEIWVTDQLGTFMGMGMGGGGPMAARNPGRAAERQAWQEAFRGKEAFPLRVVTTLANGSAVRIEATSIEKQSLPDSLFAPPADYQKMDMGGMMGGMGMRPMRQHKGGE